MIIFFLCFLHIQTFDSVNLGLAPTVRHSPLLKRSQRVAFYVRRNELDVCQWQPARGRKHNMTPCSGREKLAHDGFRHADVAFCTLRMKSGGVPGLTVGLRTPSWWEWISVSSRSRTRIFLFTASKVDWNMKSLRRQPWWKLWMSFIFQRFNLN